MSPESILEKVKIVAKIDRENRRIEIFLMKAEDVEALEADTYEYDIDFDKELAEWAEKYGTRIAIIGYDYVTEVE